MRVTRHDVSASTQNHDLAALNALFAAFGRKLGNVDALRAKRPQYARHCPTTPELMLLLRALGDTPQLPARLMALTMAATGLRISECLGARLKDFRRETEKLHLVVRDPKQAHDRWVPIPPMLWPALRAQAQHARRVFAHDQARAEPLPISVPNALDRHRALRRRLGRGCLPAPPRSSRSNSCSRRARPHRSPCRGDRCARQRARRARLSRAPRPETLMRRDLGLMTLLTCTRCRHRQTFACSLVRRGRGFGQCVRCRSHTRFTT
jgi:integrase